MKKTIKLTESDLHRIIMESVKQVINEIGDTDEGQYDLGCAAARRHWISITSNDREEADRNSEYADRIASHAALNMPNIKIGKNFDYGFEDYLKGKQKSAKNNA